MALSANASYTIRPEDGVRQFVTPVKNGTTIYNLELLAYDSTSYGAVEPFVAGANVPLAGWHIGDSIVGNSTAPRNMAKLHSNIGEAELPVATLAGTDADLGKPVYATDGGTFTITAPANGVIIGNVARASSRSGYAWVITRDITGQLSS